MDGVKLDLEGLKTTLSGLDETIGEFQQVSQGNNDLEAAIGTPDGRDRLRDRASYFESGWGKKRIDLTASLNNIRDCVDGIIAGWEETDSSLGESLTPDTVPGDAPGRGRQVA